MGYFKSKDKSIYRISLKNGELLSITDPYWYISETYFTDSRIMVVVEKNDEALRRDPTHTARGRRSKNKDRGPHPREGDRPQKTDKRKRKEKANG